MSCVCVLCVVVCESVSVWMDARSAELVFGYKVTNLLESRLARVGRPRAAPGRTTAINGAAPIRWESLVRSAARMEAEPSSAARNAVGPRDTVALAARVATGV